MSLLQKIPPLVSALAFGYGVGMAAPESTIAPMKAAVSAYQQGGPGGTSPSVNPLHPVQSAAAGGLPGTGVQVPTRGGEGRGPAWVLGGDESRELSRLRDASRPRGSEGAACELDRPTYSRPPRYESTKDDEADDVDELDTAGAEALSKLQLPDLKVSISRRTLKYVRFFTRTDRGRGMFETWLKRSGRYQEMIQTEMRERRLPEDLIWVAMIESGFDPRARSPAGAVGLWQFMPPTGAVYGLQQSRHLDQRKNPRLATQAAAHHLRDLYMRFGSWDLALAAYNMGYEQLLDKIDQYGTTDFNELARQRAIPTETASYVPKIAAAAIVANNLERFGFDRVDVSRPVDSAEIAVPPGTPLKTIAKAAGVATSTIRSLNPDMLGDRVPPGRGDFLVMVPADTMSRALAALPAMLETEPLVSEEATVLDPVSLLGGRELPRTRARRGEESLLSLLPPYKKRRTMRDPAADLEALVADGDHRGADDDRADDEPRQRPRKARKDRETLLYRVGPGDTLIGIARQFAADIEDVARENQLDTDAKLRAGMLLKLRVRPEVIERGVGSTSAEDAKDAKDAKLHGGASSEKAGAGKGEKAERSDRSERRKKGRT